MKARTRIRQSLDLQALRQLPPFRAFDARAVAMLAPAVGAFRYPGRTAVPDRADPPGALYLLGSSRVLLFQPDPDGERTTLLYLHVGNLFRLEAGEDTGQSLREAVTHEESLIYCIDPARLRLPAEAQLAIERAARVQLQRQLRAAFDCGLPSITPRLGGGQPDTSSRLQPSNRVRR